MVICDRFVDSSLAYQGVGRALGMDAVSSINDFATGGLSPDLTVLLDVSPADGRSRRTVGADGATLAEDRLESEPDEFHLRIRDAFLLLASRNPQRYLVLDASTGVSALAAAINASLDGFLDGPEA